MRSAEYRNGGGNFFAWLGSIQNAMLTNPSGNIFTGDLSFRRHDLQGIQGCKRENHKGAL